MSTIPGDESWNDAGLVDPDAHEPVNLVDEVSRTSADSGEDYTPGTPRPDLFGEASEADVADQAVALPPSPEDPDA
ncbi:MAG TPA: hypothetical protein VK063_06215 [Beutenbergiaceae bacterium]|nr:hypothetical protein [Beutenbergiaceae bacterium]